jgi:outer membrane lipoprotein-sorting protein
MYRNIFLFISILVSCRIAAQDATEIVKKADEKARGKTSIATITIQIIRPNWTREMKVKGWTKGNDLSLILVNEPVKDKGVVYLKRKKEVWNWIPSIERTIKLPPSMMSQSWMGTDFTNDDLVKEASIVEDYNHSILGDTIIDNRLCYKIQLLPKPESAVVWGKILTCIDKKDNLMLYVEYYDEDNKPVNTLKASDIKMLGGRWLPSRMEMTPSDKKNNKTVLIYNSLQFDNPIDDNFFTSQNMPKVK